MVWTHRCLHLFALVFLSSAVSAHHGAVTNPSLYLTDEMVELEGTITEVFWRNPHVRMRLGVANGANAQTIWELELGPNPPLFRRLGISPEFAEPGTEVRVAGYVSRRNPRSLGVLHLLANGREFVDGYRETRWQGERISISYRPPTTADAAPSDIETARSQARSIFRVWGGNVDGTPAHPPPEEYRPFLTERGQALADAYDPVTDNPELECRQGMPTTMFDPVPMQIIDNGDEVLIRVQEHDVRRVIHLAGVRENSPSQGTPLGYSVGQWQDDVLIVTTTGIDWPYFDPYGTPQSDQMKYTERFGVSADGAVLEYSLTAEDPIMFTRPITFSRRREWTPGVEIEEYNCIAEWGESGD